MKHAELRVEAVRFLRTEALNIRHRPHQLVFPAKAVAESFGGYAGALGHVADKVAADLRAMGIACKYDSAPNPKVFILDLTDA
jgi:hypothetical protein